MMNKRFISCLIKKFQTSKKSWKSFTKKLKLFKSTKKPPRLFYNYNNQHQVQNAFSKVYLSDMFSDKMHNKKVVPATKGETSSGVASKEKKIMYSVDDAWKALVASSPQLRGVDERANEFICKFRQDMKLQKERSLLEFQDMLARGV